MLLTGFNFKNTNAKDISKFTVYYKYNNKGKEDFERLKAIFEKLDVCMTENAENKKFLTKSNIPALAMVTDKFIKLNGKITDESYREFLDEWVSADPQENENKKKYYESSKKSTTNKNKVVNRVNTTQKVFEEHFNIND